MCTDDDFYFNLVSELKYKGSDLTDEEKTLLTDVYGVVGFGLGGNSSYNIMGMLTDNTTNDVSQQVTFNLMSQDSGNSEVYIGDQQPSGYQGKTLAVGPEGCSSWSVPVTSLGFGGFSIYTSPGTNTCGLLQTEYPFIGMQLESRTKLFFDL